MFIRFLTALLLASNLAWAQLPGLNIHRATSKITVDGVMNELDWQNANVANNFKQYFPFDSSTAKAQTEVRMTYDENFIYLFAIMHNLEPRMGLYISLADRKSVV